MGKYLQVIINVCFYAFLLWLLYDSTIKEWDPWLPLSSPS